MFERETIIKKLLKEAISYNYNQYDDIPQKQVIPDSGEVPQIPGQIYKICNAIARQYRLYPAMRALMMRKWGVKSMEEMSFPALEALYRFMRGLERHMKNF